MRSLEGNEVEMFFFADHSDKWIGATFNWEKNRWQWGYSGRNLQYQAFSRMNPGYVFDLLSPKIQPNSLFPLELENNLSTTVPSSVPT